MIQQFIEHFTYAGLFLTLFAAGLGLPIPEEVAIIAGGVLAHEHVVHWWIALPVCILGVLGGDVALYAIGHHWGERVLEWRVVRRVLTPEREETLRRGIASTAPRSCSRRGTSWAYGRPPFSPRASAGCRSGSSCSSMRPRRSSACRSASASRSSSPISSSASCAMSTASSAGSCSTRSPASPPGSPISRGARADGPDRRGSAVVARIVIRRCPRRRGARPCVL